MCPTGEGVDGRLIPDQWKRRGVGSDEDAGDDVAEHHRLTQMAEQHGHQTGYDHHDRQILKEGCSMHPKRGLGPKGAFARG